jgi:hypothetical protein
VLVLGALVFYTRHHQAAGYQAINHKALTTTHPLPRCEAKEKEG